MSNTTTANNQVHDPKINSLAALNDRPTPETDAFAGQMSEEFIDPAWLEFSQQLERERDEAREIAQQLIHTATTANETLDPEHEQEDDETQYLRSLAGSATICINKDDSAGGHFELFPQYEN